MNQGIVKAGMVVYALFILNGAALIVTIVFFRDEFRDIRTVAPYEWGVVVLTGLMAGFALVHERRMAAAQPPDNV